jgi:hypothetical protein
VAGSCKYGDTPSGSSATELVTSRSHRFTEGNSMTAVYTLV